ncbi:MAG: hypothetical protein K2K47_09295 [Duncaniella sp.]|nr:hypothetical protein [Duncaniella sp.]
MERKVGSKALIRQELYLKRHPEKEQSMDEYYQSQSEEDKGIFDILNDES